MHSRHFYDEDGLKALIWGRGGAVVAVFFSFFRRNGLSDVTFLISAGGSFHPCVNSFLLASGPVGISLGGFEADVAVGGRGGLGGGFEDIASV